jgi:hypothetical protein
MAQTWTKQICIEAIEAGVGNGTNVTENYHIHTQLVGNNIYMKHVTNLDVSSCVSLGTIHNAFWSARERLMQTTGESPLGWSFPLEQLGYFL